MNSKEDVRGNRRWAKKVLCTTCKRVIRKPVQLCCCGVILCQQCVTDTCPVMECNASNFECYRDKAFERDCRNKVLCCPICNIWIGSVEQFQGHLENYHCSDEIDALLQQDPAAEPIQMAASVMETANIFDGSSVESYNWDNEQIMQASSSHMDRIFLHVPVQAVDKECTNTNDQVLCANCGANISSNKLNAHRENCYHLTEYKDVCYPHKNAIFEECSSHFGNSEMVQGSSVSIHSPFSCALEDKILQNISVQEIEIIKKHHNNIIVQQMKKICKMNAPIEYPDYTGRMKWRVADLSCRIRDAEHSSILSPLFYTSVHGYAMRLKLDFDQQQNRLQLMIQVGRYDDQLHWPFHGIFDVGLLNFGTSDGVCERSLSCEAPQCFTEYEGNTAASVLLPSFSCDFVYGDGVYINCFVQAKRRCR